MAVRRDAEQMNRYNIFQGEDPGLACLNANKQISAIRAYAIQSRASGVLGGICNCGCLPQSVFLHVEPAFHLLDPGQAPCSRQS